MKETIFILMELKQFAIPKRGRIRLALAIVLLIVCARFLARYCQHTDQPASGPRMGAWKQEDIQRYIAEQDFFSNLKAVNYYIRGADTLVIKTTINDRIQKNVCTLLDRYHPRCGAAMVFKPKTGEILAAASYRNPKEQDALPDSANMLFWNRYPAASVFKIITAASAIENGRLSPDNLVAYTGSNYTLYRYQLADRNDRWTRRVSMREAFARSINPVFGKIGQDYLGASLLTKTAGVFLFNQRIGSDLRADSSIFLPPSDPYGVAEAACGFTAATTLSPLHGALIAGAVCASGTVHAPYLIKQVHKRDKPLYEPRKPETYTLVSPETALLLRSIMGDVVRIGTARKSFKTLFNRTKYGALKIGGKTGSLDSSMPEGRCDWFVGFAIDPGDPDNAIALAIVTVHGAYWTVHSSYIGAEAIMTWYDDRDVTLSAAVK